MKNKTSKKRRGLRDIKVKTGVIIDDRKVLACGQDYINAVIKGIEGWKKIS